MTLLCLALACSLPAQNPAATSPGTVPNAPSGDAPAAAPQSPASPQQSAATAPAPEQANPAATPAQPVSVILPNAKEIAQAKREFDAGKKLASAGKLDNAFHQFEHATQLDPRNPDYLRAREFTRQELVMEAMDRGNKAMAANDRIAALAEYRRAVEYDPTNEYALQRLRELLPVMQEPHSEGMRIVEESAPIELWPNPAHRDFHYRGDSRGLLTTVAQAYGITAVFDDSVQSRRVHFNIEDVDFATAMEAASAVTKTFRVPLSGKQIYLVADSIENRRTFERMTQRTFYIPEASDQQLTEMMNSLRILLNIRYIALQRSQSAIIVRGPQAVVEAAARVLESLTGSPAQVMLDVRVYQIAATLLRQIGTTWPTQFTMFHISPELLAGLGQNVQNLINQLIASGGINQANSVAIQALLAQLQSQAQNPLLTQPFATFGGGQTLFGLTTGGVGITETLTLNTSDVHSLEHITLRASQNQLATLHIGERYPIVNATFSPIYNTPQIAKVIGNSSYTAPVPSIQYEDLGINLKATPAIHANRDVTLKLELQVRSLGTQSVNGIPVINNREYNGTLSIKNGESGVVAGLISLADAQNIMGYPFLSRVPGFTYASSRHDKNFTDGELMIVITPHIISLQPQGDFATRLPSAD